MWSVRLWPHYLFSQLRLLIIIILTTPIPHARIHVATATGARNNMATIKPSDVWDLPLQPFQPRNISFPHHSFGKTNPVKRSFQATWFNKLQATDATSERSFSALRHVKTYLRTTMIQQRLNNLSMFTRKYRQLRSYEHCTRICSWKRGQTENVQRLSAVKHS